MDESIAAVQMNCIPGDIKGNACHAADLFSQIKKDNQNVLMAVLPEMCIYGYSKLDKIAEMITQKGIYDALHIISGICGKNHMYAAVGAPFFGENGIENAMYLIDPDGFIQHIYSKMHLIDIEEKYFAAGSEIKICETEFARLGFLICWDSAFADMAVKYSREKADILIMSSAWEKPYQRQFELAVCGMGFTSDIPVIAANRAGCEGELVFTGHSMICDCMGNIIGELNDNKEGYICIPLNQLRNKELRKGFGTQRY